MKIIFSLVLLFCGLYVKAEVKLDDFSFYDGSSNFLTSEKVLTNKKQKIDTSDFIFPLPLDQIEAKIEEKAEENKEKEKVMQKPKSGWKYVVKKGETLWSISKKFKVSIKELLAVNNLNEKSIVKAGDKILIPGVKPEANIIVQPIKKLAGKFVSALTEVGNFVIPTSGFNWGIKHSNNGSDIAADCGTPVYAANSGIVVESLDGWNGGYGNYIIIKHENNVYTLYGHLSLRIVQKGDKVEKGELIGYVGNTGKVEGPTGCHLHFEVRGSTNPLLK